MLPRQTRLVALQLAQGAPRPLTLLLEPPPVGLELSPPRPLPLELALRTEAGEADPPEDPVELEELDLLKEDRKNLEEVLRVLGEEKARLETMLS